MTGSALQAPTKPFSREAVTGRLSRGSLDASESYRLKHQIQDQHLPSNMEDVRPHRLCNIGKWSGILIQPPSSESYRYVVYSVSYNLQKQVQESCSE